ncbi:DNA topoisomerase I [Candidatus Woesearchaeota archaeon]|nr:DNA topoisomerase I [Candidatus Woesearchaeota archaeon]
MYELIITEKPNASKKIAEALAEGKPIKENLNGVPYYQITRGKKDIVVACAVGHLYGLAEKEKKGWIFPVFEIEWKPASEVSRKSGFSKKYLAAIKKLAKGANEFTVATDYDQEGSVIGKNIIFFACGKKDACRMKFSTLTKPDLVEAYENKSKHLDWGQAEAGDARHHLDFFNGINYSRALTSSIKTAGSFKIMSTGRVQGPALKIIADREKEIKAFKPVPFWQIELKGNVNKGDVTAWHKEDKFWEKEKANKVMKKVKGAKEAFVCNKEKREFKQSPPVPFDLTALQVESYRCHKISPKETLEIAQELYTSGFISYPRTSSQQLPDKIGFKKILADISKQKNYSQLAKKLLSKQYLKPNNGKKTDPAHPAIYPTGIIPGGINPREEKIYDLIVKRFMATFAEPALRETMTIGINCRDEIFIAKGTRTIEKGWHVFYEPYVKLEEEELPRVNKNDKVNVKKIQLHSKETTPPKRYTPASIIKELERRGLGTKATRSEIVDTLFQRGYVTGKAIEATNLGIKTVETLEKHCPKIVDEALTRHFEEEMEDIREGKIKSEDVLNEAKKAISAIINDFKKHEKEIGKELLNANIETRNELTTLGKCPVCKKGDMQIRRGKFGSFAACNLYPQCKTTFSLPSNALIKPAGNICETCSYPKVLAIKKGKRPTEFCLNPKCPSKHVEGDAGKEAKEIAKGIIEKECPQCKEGKLVLRGSIYGKFYGCSKYPKCKYTEKLGEGPLKEDFGKKKSSNKN